MRSSVLLLLFVVLSASLVEDGFARDLPMLAAPSPLPQVAGSPSEAPSPAPLAPGSPSDVPSPGSPSKALSPAPLAPGSPSDAPSPGSPSEAPSPGSPSEAPSPGSPSEAPSPGSPSEAPSPGSPSEAPSPSHLSPETPSPSPPETPLNSPSQAPQSPKNSPSNSPSEAPKAHHHAPGLPIQPLHPWLPPLVREVIQCWSPICQVKGCTFGIMRAFFTSKADHMHADCCKAIAETSDDCANKMLLPLGTKAFKILQKHCSAHA